MITRLELLQYRRLTDHHRRAPEAKAFRRRLEAAMEQMAPVERRLVFLRYCCRLSWVSVGMRIHYSERQARRLDRKICKMLEET
jgi:hypothetical protein